MLRGVRLTRASALAATVVVHRAVAAAGVDGAHRAALEKAAATSATHGASLQPVTVESQVPATSVPDVTETHQPPPPPRFLFQGRRGSSSSDHYVTRSNVGHPDVLAEMLGAGRADPEWMWLKLLCFLCVTATFGTTLYGYFFAEHIKYFKDEPWSPFTY
ncbi:hypothetical protein NESM_000135900 [Novymonas esmeraldas]|uniref:Uncharacterized protein n=1 Tax=Novymonas esmeraldas TaxID=1808958 RepID=A0AAW0F2J8_9TRYP